MSDTQFLHHAQATLTQIYDALEPHYESGAIDELEMEGGIVTIADENGRAVVINIHEASQQIWLASPMSGGLHFDFEEAENVWKTRDSVELVATLNENLHIMSGVRVSL